MKTSRQELPARLSGRRYALDRRLGAGASGSVFLALDRLLGTEVAVKRFDASAREAALREVEVLAGVRHPGVVSLLDVVVEPGDGALLAAFERIEGQDLSSATRGRPLDESVGLVAQVLRALAFVHRHGLVHGDIKPANLLVSRGASGPRATLIDFGFARGVGHAGSTGVGTLGYLAPEVLAGGIADARSDLFSLGLVLFEILAGRLPTEGLSNVERVRSHQVAEFTLPPETQRHVPAALADLVRSLLRRDPGLRPGSCAEVLSTLAAACARKLPLEDEESALARIDSLDLLRAAPQWLDLDALVRSGRGTRRIEIPQDCPEVLLRIRIACARAGRPAVDVDAGESVDPRASLPPAAVVFVHGAAGDPTGDVGNDRLVLELGARAADDAATLAFDPPSANEAHERIVAGLGVDLPTTFLARMRRFDRFDAPVLRCALRAAVRGGALIAEAGRVRLDAGRALDRLDLPAGLARFDVHALPEGALPVLAALALTALDVAQEIVADCVGSARAGPLQAALEAARLIETPAPGRIALATDAVAAHVIGLIGPELLPALRRKVAKSVRDADPSDALRRGEAGRLLLDAGGDPEEAANLLLGAGMELRRAGRAREARRFLGELVERSPVARAPESRLLALRWLCDTLSFDGEDDRALLLAREAVALPGAADERGRVYAILARTEQRLGRPDAALAATGAGLDLADLAPETRALLLTTRSHVLRGVKRSDEALASARDALDLLGATPSLERSAATNALATALVDLGRIDEAVEGYRAAERDARDLGRADMARLAVANIGRLLYDHLRTDEALDAIVPAFARFEAAGELRHLEALLITLLRARVSRGELAAARDLALVGNRSFAGGVVPRNHALFLMHVAEAERRSGNGGEAERLLRQARGLLGDREPDPDVAVIDAQRARLDSDRGDAPAARRAFARVLRALRRGSRPDAIADGFVLAAEHHLVEGRPGAALQLGTRAARAAQSSGSPRRVATALGVLADVNLARGDAATALVLLDDALQPCSGTGHDVLAAHLGGLRAAALDALGRAADADAEFDRAIGGLAADGAAPERARVLLLRARTRTERARSAATDSSRAGTAFVAGLLAEARDDLEGALAAAAAARQVPLAARVRDELAALATPRGGTGSQGEAGAQTAYSGLESRLRKLERLLEINKALNSELDPRRLLSLILDAAIDLCRARRGFVVLVDDQHVEVRVARNFAEQDVHEPEFQISRSVARRVALSGEPILTSDAVHDRRLRSISSIAELRVLSILCVPLRSRDRVLGAVYIDHPDAVDRFAPADLDILEDLAQAAGIALERARLHQENVERGDALQRAKTEIERLNGELLVTVAAQAKELVEVKESADAVRRAASRRHDYASIVSRSECMDRLLVLLDRITETDIPVLVLGESGTGKELVARAIHFNGARKNKPFMSVNCAAMTQSLIESELFGHMKGAFTGADRDREGLFEAAHQGTLFLDEIGDMSIEVQSRLLRVIQYGEFYRVGGRKPIHVDVRIIAATHQNLPDRIQAGSFREDLFYRLNVAQVNLPPLRERHGDVPLLVDHFAEEYARESGAEPKRFSAEAMDAMNRYSWPGNVRELQNEVRRAAFLGSERAIVRVEDLSPALRVTQRGQIPEPDGQAPLRTQLESHERRVVDAALRDARGNKAEAARRLGITVRGLYKILERHRLGGAGTPRRSAPPGTRPAP